MERDPIREYHAALRRRSGRGVRIRRADVAPGEGQRQFAARLAAMQAAPPGDLPDLASTRRLIAPSPRDFGAAIRVLQRHNHLLQKRFGIAWDLAAGAILAEAVRRGASAAALARALASQLRREGAGA
ncbi:MAG: hypothetical protein WEC75_03185 [Dehalococcoidia bacterium]